MNFEEWMKHNIFCSVFAEDNFINAILDRIFADLHECYDFGTHKLTADKLIEFVAGEFTDVLLNSLDNRIEYDTYLNEGAEE